MTATNTQQEKFWIEKPQALGWRGISLLVPCVCSAIGFCAFSILAFGFTELQVLPQTFRTVLVLTGSFSLAIGGEVGTLAGVIEIFRKSQTLKKWDKIALVISVLATISSFLLAFSALLGATNTWASWLQVYGPVVMGVISALDAYGSFLEMGQYLNGFDKRMKQWLTQYQEWQKDNVTYQRDIKRRVNEHRINTALGQDNTQNVSQIGEKQQTASSVEQLQQAKREHDVLQQAQRFEAIMEQFSVNPKTSVTQLADSLNVSRTTIYRDLGTLKEQGKLKKNGVGYLLIE